MSDMQYPSPPLPPSQPQQKDNKIQILAASFFALAIAILVAVIAIPSSNSDSGDRGTTMIQVPDVTVAPANKYDLYYEHVLNNSGQANTMGKTTVIKTGDLVCQALDEGNSVADVVAVVASASTTTSAAEYGAAVVFAAITYLCSEYDAMMQSWLRN